MNAPASHPPPASHNKRILDAMGGGDDGSGYVCLSLADGVQAIDALTATLCVPWGRALVIVNGERGRHLVDFIDRMGRPFNLLETADGEAITDDDLDMVLSETPDITHVIAIECEENAPVANPIGEIAGLTTSYGRGLIIDAAGCPEASVIDIRTHPFDGVAVSDDSGAQFAVVREEALSATSGNAPDEALDLYRLWQATRADP